MAAILSRGGGVNGQSVSLAWHHNGIAYFLGHACNVTTTQIFSKVNTVKPYDDILATKSAII